MNRTNLQLILFSLLFACSPQNKAEYYSSNFELIKLAEGVYSCIHKIGGKAICNVGIIDNGKETIIFDTFLSPKSAEEIPQIVAYYGLSPIKYVINSHFHNDHIRGNQVFPSEVNIISTTRTLELITENEPAQLEFETEFAIERFHHYDSLHKAFNGDTTSRKYLQIQMWRPYYETLSRSHVEVQTRLPTLTFENEKSLDGSTRKVQLISKGKGHTESDLILYLPEDKILFSGDLVFNNCHPYLGNGYPDEWKNWLNSILTMEINTVVPGHGKLGDKETVRQMVDYIGSVDKLAQSMIIDNIPLENVGDIEIPKSYSSWWFDRFFVPNLRFMYDLKNSK